MNHYRSIGRIVLSTAVIVAAGVSTSRGDLYDPFGLQVHQHPWGPNGPEFTYPNVSRWANVLTGQEPLNNRVAQRVTASHTERFTDLNLSVNLPGGPWSKLDPKKTGSHACLLLSRQNPEMMISLAGERAGVEADNTNATLLTESQTKMKSLPGAVFSTPTDLPAGGIDGKLYEATIGEDQPKTHYAIWVAAHHGYNYKLAVYGNEKNKPEIDAALRNFVRGIKHIESTKLAHTGANPTITNAKPLAPNIRVAERTQTATETNERSLLRGPIRQ